MYLYHIHTYSALGFFFFCFVLLPALLNELKPVSGKKRVLASLKTSLLYSPKKKKTSLLFLEYKMGFTNLSRSDALNSCTQKENEKGS